ncbi:MAG: hypothetical protein KJ623_04380 [Nanoarchaeota archaeon]|nr:hypothetical protein [Nanoarchaeota archaeon]MBU0962675.1 hypothetical protein [Nanoarchaeota archaeon]
MGKLHEWKQEIWHHKHLILVSLLFLIVSIVLDYYAGVYVTKTSGVVAPDLILDHIPTLDLDFIFIYGYMLVIALIFLYPLIFKVKELHKVIGQFSLLIMIRSAFTCFTHLSVPSSALTFNVPWVISTISFKNDLFFSGHTAVAFLGFLLFRKEKIGYFFLVSSLVLGIVVLFMHVHYSIDVLSAFFITYGSFNIGKWFFNKINHYSR